MSTYTEEVALVARATNEIVNLAITAPFSGDGESVDYSTPSVRARLVNVSQADDFWYRIDSGAWHYVGQRQATEFDIDFSSQTLSLKRGEHASSTTAVSLTAYGVPAGVYSGEGVPVGPSITDGTNTVASPSVQQFVGATVSESPAGTAKVTIASALYGDGSDGSIHISAGTNFPALGGVSAWEATTHVDAGELRKSTGTNVRVWKAVISGTTGGSDPFGDDAPTQGYQGKQKYDDGTVDWEQVTSLIASAANETVMEGDVYASSLTIDDGQTLWINSPGGGNAGIVSFRIFVSGTCTVNGTISGAGQSGPNSIYGAPFGGAGYNAAYGQSGDGGQGDVTDGAAGADLDSAVIGAHGGRGGDSGANSGGRSGRKSSSATSPPNDYFIPALDITQALLPYIVNYDAALSVIAQAGWVVAVVPVTA